MATEGENFGSANDTENEETEKSIGERQLEGEKLLLKLKRDKRLRKSEMT